MDVAVATLRNGVTRVGLAAGTWEPVPASATEIRVVVEFHRAVWPLMVVPEVETLPPPGGCSSQSRCTGHRGRFRWRIGPDGPGYQPRPRGVPSRDAGGHIQVTLALR